MNVSAKQDQYEKGNPQKRLKNQDNRNDLSHIKSSTKENFKKIRKKISEDAV